MVTIINIISSILTIIISAMINIAVNVAAFYFDGFVVVIVMEVINCPWSIVIIARNVSAAF